MLLLNDQISEMSGVGERFIPKLKNLHIQTIRDLLWHFPVRYEDYSEIYKISDLQANQEATIQGVVSEIDGRHSFRRNLYITEATISDESDSIKAIWFNQPYIKNTLRPGRIANFSGKVTFREGEIYLSNPAYELISEHRHHETRHTARVVPIYPETKGLTSKGLRYLIKPALDNLEALKEFIPEKILDTYNLPEINEAISSIHFPESLEDALRARKRFAFEDLFLLQLYNIKQKALLQKEAAPKIDCQIEEIKSLIEKIPFRLTETQKKSLWEIIKDLEKIHPMNRLLQGDVGSGKTIVAAIASIITAKKDYQAAFMAPTEILARQHYETMKKFFGYFEGGIALLTGSESKLFCGQELESKPKKTDLLKEIGSGKIKIVIGTHALIEKSVSFKKLGLIIIDEQHRFGVKQRAALMKESRPESQVGKNKKSDIVPHFLSMSATPIPRTLSLTLFGDLDISLITELPADRKSIITRIVSPENRTKAYIFIKSEVKKGRQVFVICPRIEKAEIENEIVAGDWQKFEVRSVKEEYEKLSKKVFPDLKIAMLHGKMKAKEKEDIMKNFKEGKTDILVSTSVVEVGVDIPNATVMMIEGTERFGLAQLYQFRGRVGRGAHQSYCLLFTDSKGSSIKTRLKSIVEAKNGFELAERDLEMRGPGQFLGASQTGMPDLAMKAIQNPGLVKTAREAALEVIKNDPSLSRHPDIKTRIGLFEKNVHWE